MDLPDINLPLLNDIALDLCDELSHCGEGCAGSTVLYAGAGAHAFPYSYFLLVCRCRLQEGRSKGGAQWSVVRVCVRACMCVRACVCVCVSVSVCVYAHIIIHLRIYLQ